MGLLAREAMIALLMLNVDSVHVPGRHERHQHSVLSTQRDKKQTFGEKSEHMFGSKPNFAEEHLSLS
jgi:hypothetical protein